MDSYQAARKGEGNGKSVVYNVVYCDPHHEGRSDHAVSGTLSVSRSTDSLF